MTPQEFRQIRIALKLSAQGMADYLGLKSGRMIRYYEAGAKIIPPRVIKLLKNIKDKL